MLLLFFGDFKRAVCRLQLLYSLNSSYARLACPRTPELLSLAKVE